LKRNQKDSCLYYARMALTDARISSQRFEILEAANLIVDMLRDKNMPDSVVYYQDIVLVMKDSLFSADKFRQLQVLALREQQRKLDIVREQDEFMNRVRLLVLSGILLFVVVVTLIIYRNFRQKHKVNLRLENTLNELKSTQSQLIQSEKMASLGELTAGIAHEIQNPLNFVNNFSEVSNELLDEMKEEFKNGALEEGFTIADDIKQNLEKITHHGKRADNIVKGMLAHSRTSNGEKVTTDINVLADEYLRLSYHGLRAKDKDFNADYKTDFDPNLPKVNVIPQDIGRVLLNIINNAFQACTERSRSAVGIGKTATDETTTNEQPDYNPMVVVSSKNMGNHIEIRVKDNGNGIPETIKEKIFQPFFTTKPTGQGTGLGLSLSYDIVKAHGGEIKMETKEGEGLPAEALSAGQAGLAQAGSEFIIHLPIEK